MVVVVEVENIHRRSCSWVLLVVLVGSAGTAPWCWSLLLQSKEEEEVVEEEDGGGAACARTAAAPPASCCPRPPLCFESHEATADSALYPSALERKTNKSFPKSANARLEQVVRRTVYSESIQDNTCLRDVFARQAQIIDKLWAREQLGKWSG